MKRHLALVAAIGLSLVVYEITGVILRARAARPVVVAEEPLYGVPRAPTASRRRDPLDGLVPMMRTDSVARPLVGYR